MHPQDPEPTTAVDDRVFVLRHVLLNLAGHAVPLVVALVAIPVTLQGLGEAGFGLLAFAWVVLGFIGNADLGLGKATTKYLAELDAAESPDRGALIQTTLRSEMILGLLVGGTLIAVAPVLARYAPSATATDEWTTVLRWLGVAVVPTLWCTGARSALEGLRRFDLTLAGRIPLALSTFAFPAVAVLLGAGATGAVAALVMGRIVAAVAFGMLVRKGTAGGSGAFSWPWVGRLLSFGRWVMLSSLLVPVFVYADRAFITAIEGLEGLARYTPPYEAITRLLVLPTAIAGALFPTFSALSSRKQDTHINTLVGASTRHGLLLSIPVVFVFFVFAEDLLTAWLGVEVAREGATIMRLLSVAVLLNGLGYVPAALMEGVGRPDVMGRYHLIELPLYLAVAWLLVVRDGAEGAAMAWVLRMVWTIPIFFVVAHRVASVRVRDSLGGKTAATLVAAGLMLAAGVALVAAGSARLSKLLVSALVLSGYLGVAWTTLTTVEERARLRLSTSSLSDIRR